MAGQAHAESWARLAAVPLARIEEVSTGQGEPRPLLRLLNTIGGDVLRLAALHRASFDQPFGSAKTIGTQFQAQQPQLAEALVQRLGLAQPPDGTQDSSDGLLKRALGALTAAGQYPWILEAALEVPQPSLMVASFKTALLEFAAARRQDVRFKVLAEDGPPHDRTFTVEVRFGSNSTATGMERSKKAAEEAAAEELIRSALPEAGQAHITRPPEQPREFVVDAHREPVQALAKTLGLGSGALPKLSSALTWPGTTEVAEPHRRRAGGLAQLGSQVIQVEALLRILSDLTAGGAAMANPTLRVNEACSAESLAGVFAAAGLGPAYLTTQERSVGEVTDRARADAVQAVTAVTFLEGAALGSATTSLPELDRVLAQRLRRSGDRPESELRDPKSRLQEVLAALGLEVSYAIAESFGKAHVAEHASRMTIRAPTGREFRVRGPRGRSRREAEKRIAAIALHALALPASVEPDSTSGRLVRFVLGEGAEALRDNPKAAQRLTALGTGPLALRQQANWAGLDAWLRRLSDFAESAVREVWINAFRRSFGSVDRQLPSRTANDLLLIADAVRQLDPEHPSDLGSSELWSRLLSAASLARIRSRPRELRRLSDLAADIDLLLSRRQISVQPHDFECRIVERSGQLLSLVDLFAADGSTVAFGRAQVDGAGALEVLIDASRGQSRDSGIGRDLLDALAHDWPLLSADIEDSGTRLLLLTEPCTDLVDLLVPGQPLSSEQASALHDLKNTLSAFDGAARKAQSLSGPERYRAQYESSVHLHDAQQLCLAILKGAGAAQPPLLIDTDLAAFLDGYVTELMTRRPAHIAVDVPALAPLPTQTDPALLRAALDNIVKNAIEAMSGGGHLRFELQADPPTVIVSDSGPGMRAEDQEGIAAGQPPPSTKEGGTGLGLMTVIVTMRRLGGRVAVQSTPGGTKFSLVLGKVT